MADHRALVVSDPYTNYLDPAVRRATVVALEAAGVGVRVPEGLPPPDRSAYSQGFVDRARSHARTVVDRLAPFVVDGWSIVVPEPSAAAMLQSDYRHLLGTDVADPVAAATYGPMEYLHRIDGDIPVAPDGRRYAFHAHCHQQSLGREVATPRMLDALGFDVHHLDSGCCGMAGSFRYEVDHYELRRSIADILMEQVEGRRSGCRPGVGHLLSNPSNRFRTPAGSPSDRTRRGATRRVI